jgi:aminomethyltransferase
MDDAQAYEAIRQNVVVYPRGKRFAEVTGLQRTELLAFALAKSTEYSMPGTSVETLAFDDDGNAIDSVMAIFEEERTILMSEQEHGVIDDLPELIERLELEDVQVNDLEGWCGIQAEGPNCYHILDDLTDDDLSSMGLSERREARTPLGAEGIMIRTGKTAEYCFYWLGEADEAETLQSFLDRAEAEGGCLATEKALYRAMIELMNPIFPDLFNGITLREAGVEWMSGGGREDEYRGRPEEIGGPRERGIVAIRAYGQDVPPVDTPIEADGTVIGRVYLTTPMVGLEDGLGLALLDEPFAVPGLELTSGGIDVVTIPRPAIDPISWVQTMTGEEAGTSDELQEAIAAMTEERSAATAAAAEAAARAAAEAEAAEAANRADEYDALDDEIDAATDAAGVEVQLMSTDE